MTRRMRAGWVVLVAGLALAGVGLTSRAHADGMRCGTRLVSDGDLMLEVRNVCGPPDQSLQRVEKRVISRYVDGVCHDPQGRQFRCGQVVQDTVDVVLDEWIYDFGTRQLVRTVVFEGGRLIRIITGGYGTKET